MDLNGPKSRCLSPVGNSLLGARSRNSWKGQLGRLPHVSVEFSNLLLRPFTSGLFVGWFSGSQCMTRTHDISLGPGCLGCRV